MQNSCYDNNKGNSFVQITLPSSVASILKQIASPQITVSLLNCCLSIFKVHPTPRAWERQQSINLNSLNMVVEMDWFTQNSKTLALMFLEMFPQVGTPFEAEWPTDLK